MLPRLTHLLLACVASAELRTAARRSPLALAPKIESQALASAADLTKYRGGGGEHYLSPRELAVMIVADLTPHGMLPLAWARDRRLVIPFLRTDV